MADRWVPPPSSRMSEARARVMLGDDYQLWVRCNRLAEKNEVDYHHVWSAAQDLRSEGFGLRDGRIVERARQYQDRRRAYMEELAERRRRKDEDEYEGNKQDEQPNGG